MNFLNIFEDRIAGIFGAAQAPFSFKKLAKQAAREMEDQTLVINGVDTAPALYTVLIAADDDPFLAPFYPQLAREVAEFVKAQAEKKHYRFAGAPLVRFMIDPSLKAGKFSVFAENVDAQTLNRLREEEALFLGVGSSRGGLGGAAGQRAPQPQPQPAARGLRPIPQPAMAKPSPADSMSAGLDVMPQEAVLDAEQALLARGVATAQPPAPSAAPRQVPQTVRAPQAVPAPAPTAPVTCLLIDRQSGRTYTASAPRTVIGRERTPGGVVLHDPNVSRSHAELSHDGQGWRIRDLNSTNGTLVNDVDVDECPLRDGDLITLGLTNLEFREN